jgi:DNA-binding beta-propeller fold protein YncE
VLIGIILGSGAEGYGYTEEPKVIKTTRLFDINVQLPTDIVVSRSRKIYVVDGTNNRILVFSHTGSLLHSFGRRGSEAGMFNSPTGIGIDKEDNIYICDSGNRRVQVFSENGGFLRSFTIKDGPMGPARPVDIAINDRTKLCYITDSVNHRVIVCDLKGKQVYEWGGKGDGNQEFRYPATATFDEYLYVVDSLNSRVQVFEGGGIFVRSIGRWGVLPGEFFRPKGVAIDKDKNVYISDSYMDVIEVFGEGGFKYVLGDEKGEIRRFSSPLGIFAEGGRLYVAEMFANRIGVYSIEK